MQEKFAAAVAGMWASVEARAVLDGLKHIKTAKTIMSSAKRMGVALAGAEEVPAADDISYALCTSTYRIIPPALLEGGFDAVCFALQQCETETA